MIRSIIFSSVFLSLLAFAQSVFGYRLSLFGVTPDVCLSFLVFFSLKRGSLEGSIDGFLSGLAHDVISSAPLGFNAFTRTALGYVYGLFTGNIFVDPVIAPFVVVFLATMMKAILSMVLYLAFPDFVISYNFFDSHLWIEALYNAVLAPIVFALCNLGIKIARRGKA